MRFPFGRRPVEAAERRVIDPADLVVRAREATALGRREEAEELYRCAIAALEERDESDHLLVEAMTRLSVLLWFHPLRERREEARALLSRAADLTPSPPGLWRR